MLSNCIIRNQQGMKGRGQTALRERACLTYRLLYDIFKKFKPCFNKSIRAVHTTRKTLLLKFYFNIKYDQFLFISLCGSLVRVLSLQYSLKAFTCPSYLPINQRCISAAVNQLQKSTRVQATGDRLTASNCEHVSAAVRSC